MDFCSKYSDNVFAIYSALPLYALFPLWQALAHDPSCFPIIILLQSMKVQLILVLKTHPGSSVKGDALQNNLKGFMDSHL